MAGAELKRSTLRAAIADALHGAVKAYELADACVDLGLDPQADGENPAWSKRMYVQARISGKTMDELVTLARRIADDYADTGLEKLLTALSEGGVDGELKNLIFAADGPKPRIVLRDALNNDIEIVENADRCLVYNRPLPEEGLTWRQLVEWWADKTSRPVSDERGVALDLFARLEKSLDNDAERLILRTYARLYRTAGFDVPALIPQVYLHYDPYTKRELAPQSSPLARQRMDFLLLFPRRARVVIELDGRHHYADDQGRADPERYAMMVAEDRNLRLAGYEVYRFGGRELSGRGRATATLAAFFDALLTRHGIPLTPPPAPPPFKF